MRAYRALALTAIGAQRDRLEQLRIENRVTVDEYNLLLEEIDWRELAILPLRNAGSRKSDCLTAE